MEIFKLLMNTRFLQIILAFLLIFIAVFRIIHFNDAIFKAMDGTFFALLACTIILILIPLSHIKSFKAAGVEVSIEPQVSAAINAMGFNDKRLSQLNELVNSFKDDLHIISGSKILWIDDKQCEIISEKRLFRSFGMSIVSSTSSKDAEKHLKDDGDFDLIISDIQRIGDSHIINNGIDIHEGVNFIVNIRNNRSFEFAHSIPVIFYAAYDWDRLVEFSRPARETYPEPDISNTIEDLIKKVIVTLKEVRLKPIVLNKEKKPTDVEV